MSKEKQERATPFEAEEGEAPLMGTFLFVIMMLIGYIIYWGYVWYLVVIERT